MEQRPETAPSTKSPSSSLKKGSSTNHQHKHRKNKRSLKKKGKGSGNNNNVVEPHNWGFPNYLTPQEEEIYHQFITEIEKHNDDNNSNNNNTNKMKDTIFCFGYNEEEEYAYCRWLRARKFILEDTLRMVNEATALRNTVQDETFYKNAEKALGVQEAVFKTQYPQVFCGYAKNSCPLFVSKPGLINIDGLECITTVENMHHYQWHSMIHVAGLHYKMRQEADADFQRFQSVAILDLDGLSSTALSSRVMSMIKHQSYVDSLCFPETMNRLIVINAPTFFSTSWSIIKYWVDTRTRDKIEIYSQGSKWSKRLKELIDDDQLPSDYGGSAPSVADSILLSCHDESVSRRVTELISLKTHSSASIVLMEKEEVCVDVYTKSVDGAMFSVVNVEDKSRVLGEARVVLDESVLEVGQSSARVTVVKGLKGPGKFKVYGDTNRSRFSYGYEDYLVVFNIKHL